MGYGGGKGSGAGGGYGQASWKGGGDGWSSNGCGSSTWSGGGGGGKGGGGKGGGGSWGQRRTLPKFVPHRGGGEWGKRMRQMQQQQMKDDKSQREADYFWQQQEQIWRRGGQRRENGGSQEERELFAQHTGNVGIDFDKYEGISVEMSGRGADAISAISTFEELWEWYEVPDALWYNIERCKYTQPTPIQRYAIPVALSGRDAMCCAQTGSGKTCAFLLPILSCIDPAQATGTMGVEVGAAAMPKATILAPTRELCSQIHLEARKLSFGSPVRPAEVYGGVEAKPQLLELARGADIVTATPGRLLDFIDRGVLSLADVGFLVLDEADRMLDMGFVPQIRQIVEQRDMPSPDDGRMTLMFSATFPKEIQKLAQAFMRNYIWIGVGRVGGAVETVEQQFTVVPSNRGKPEALEKVMAENPNDSTLIFVAMKRTAAWLEGHLRRQRYSAVAIHGDMEQRDREASLSSFRAGRSTFLVATDVAARGLDIPKVSHVINYDLPGNIEDYVHRIGRTGRIGNRGWATSFYVPSSDERHTNANILKDLVTVLTDAGQEVPDALQREADRLGVRSSSRKGGGKNSFGGRDARGGDWGHEAWGARRYGAGKGGGGGGGWGKGKSSSGGSRGGGNWSW